MSAGMTFFVFVIGGGLYLMFNHPIAFWFVALPLFLAFTTGVYVWIKR